MAWQRLEIAPAAANPVARYLALGTHELTPVNMPELRGLASEFVLPEIPRATSALYRGWISVELADIYERTGQEALAQDALRSGHRLFTKAQRMQGVAPVARIGLNRTIAVVGVRHELLESKVEHSPPDMSEAQLYLGKLASAAYRLAEGKRNPKTRAKIRGVATECLFASLLLDTTNENVTYLPAPASPRQEAPAVVATSRRRLNKARDYTVIAYDKRLVESGRKPVQVKTAYHDEQADRYHDSIKLICRASHMHISNDSEALQMAEALAKPAHRRPGAIQRKIKIAEQNILDDIELYA